MIMLFVLSHLLYTSRSVVRVEWRKGHAVDFGVGKGYRSVR
jgi:hypothetical protein